MKKETILGEALSQVLPFLPPEEAAAEIRKLYLQVGALEEQNGALARRSAELEAVIKAMCRGCSLRSLGYCEWTCRGRDYNDTEDLRDTELIRQPGVLCGHG